MLTDNNSVNWPCVAFKSQDERKEKHNSTALQNTDNAI